MTRALSLTARFEAALTREDWDLLLQIARTHIERKRPSHDPQADRIILFLCAKAYRNPTLESSS